MRNLAFSMLIVVSSVFFVNSFPDGAPVDTCVKPLKANEPNHGQARSQPVQTSPYTFIASSSQYGPGSQITGMLSFFLVLIFYDFFFVKYWNKYDFISFINYFTLYIR